MRAVRYFGWALLAAAFAAAAAEVLVRSRPGTSAAIISAYELWYTAWPGSLVQAQIRVERLAPFLWDPVLVSLLSIPGWLLFALPGAVLSWAARRRSFGDLRKLAEVRKLEQSMILYDNLAREAREEGFEDIGDDMALDYSGHDVLDEIARNFREEDDDLGPMARAEAVRAQIAARRTAEEKEAATEQQETDQGEDSKSSDPSDPA